MEEAGLSVHGIRKSSQWMTLLRSHASAIAADTKLAAVFKKHCKHYKNSATDWYALTNVDCVDQVWATIWLLMGHNVSQHALLGATLSVM